MCCAAAGDGASALHAVCVSVCFSFYSCWPTIIVVSSRRRRYSQIIIIVIILPVPNFVCDTPLITEAGRSKKYSKIPNWKKKTNTIIKVYCDRESLRVVFQAGSCDLIHSFTAREFII